MGLYFQIVAVDKRRIQKVYSDVYKGRLLMVSTWFPGRFVKDQATEPKCLSADGMYIGEDLND
jgi:hypothetical protein